MFDLTSSEVHVQGSVYCAPRDNTN